MEPAVSCTTPVIQHQLCFFLEPMTHVLYLHTIPSLAVILFDIFLRGNLLSSQPDGVNKDTKR